MIADSELTAGLPYKIFRADRSIKSEWCLVILCRDFLSTSMIEMTEKLSYDIFSIEISSPEFNSTLQLVFVYRPPNTGHLIHAHNKTSYSFKSSQIFFVVIRPLLFVEISIFRFT